VTNIDWKKEDPSYYGKERAINEIRNALHKIKMNR
jgi:hypothetical protein